ncbi:MAG: MBL fold metallo-hydrolase [candidate division WOR-3 bacterium]
MEIIFLGSAGGRVATFRQFRGSGGFLIKTQETTIHIDPGPGAFIRLIQAGISPSDIDVFVVTHSHLDHFADINTLIEAKTLGDWNRSGILMAPESALVEDPIVLKYTVKNLSRIVALKEETSETIKDIQISVAMKHKHQGIETYGIKFTSGQVKVGYVTDGRFEERMVEAYSSCSIMIMNMTFIKPRDMDHLSLPDVLTLIREIKPLLAIINHTGMEVISKGYKKVEEEITELTGVQTICAKEFLKVKLGNGIEKTTVKLKNPLGINSLEEWWDRKRKKSTD